MERIWLLIRQPSRFELLASFPRPREMFRVFCPRGVEAGRVRAVGRGVQSIENAESSRIHSPLVKGDSPEEVPHQARLDAPQLVQASGSERVNAVTIGKHGLQIIRDQARGLLLPGVAVEHGRVASDERREREQRQVGDRAQHWGPSRGPAAASADICVEINNSKSRNRCKTEQSKSKFMTGIST